jgi:hypothetical protein
LFVHDAGVIAADATPTAMTMTATTTMAASKARSLAMRVISHSLSAD